MPTSYFASRRFRSPFLGSTERVSPLSALWAFLFGPVYYWRKRAPIEALVFALALGSLFLLDEDWDISALSSGMDMDTAIWLGFALAAPALLPACYRRKGWVELAAATR
ncbi:MAG TPA: hypothetical protein VN823_01195 [Stellaceae bacterium]|nr:hypothetical protein [Stellaceae bacterium]